MHRIVDRLAGAAVAVFDVEWNIVLTNPLAVALLGPEATDPGPDGNAVRRQFLGAPTRFVSAPEDDRAFETAVVADLRWASSRYPADRGLAQLIAEMRGTSDRFDRLWERGEVAPFVSSAKTIRHPEVGDVRVACDVLADVRTALRLTVYSAEPDTPDGRALALLGAVGTQDLAR
nr:hypothetical protein [Patulibacter sp. SYSU D01012]